MNGLEQIFEEIKRVVGQARERGLKALETEAVKSVRMNFESGGRPKWTPSRKKGKTKGTRTLVVSGKLSEVSARAYISEDKVVLTTSPEARAYAKIQNEGGTINMPARTVRTRVNKKGDTVFAKKTHKKNVKETQTKPYKIVIPARRFLVIPEEDYPRILRNVRDAIGLK